jgi:DNA-binding NarL/FixJ family response regulator
MLVADHRVNRMGPSTAIAGTEDLEVVAEVECGEEAVDAYGDCEPDVVVLDLRMHGIGGVDTIRLLRESFKDPKIIVFSNYARGEEAYKAIQAGAVGFVVKDMPIERLLDAIRRVRSGERYIPARVAAKIGERMLVHLSPRELEVLGEVAKGGSNKEIASRLGLVEGPVKTHIASILAKLGAFDRTQALVIALKAGIIDIE